MQQSGTLRKRKKRNLAKINGLSVIPYNEVDDWFDGKTSFGFTNISQQQVLPNGSDISVRMNLSGGSQSARVTRDPKFHDELGLPDVENPFQGSRRYSQIPDDTALERSHFLSKSTMARLKQVIFLAQTSGAAPWVWNEQEFRVDKWSSGAEKLWKFQRIFIVAQGFLLTLFINYIFAKEMSNTDSYREAFISSNVVAWYVCFCLWSVNTQLYLEQTREYINTLLQFNKEYVDKYLISLDGHQEEGWKVNNLCIPGGIMLVLISVSMFLAMPHLPFYLISYVYPKPWYWLIPGAIQQYMVYGQVITWFDMTFWISVAHTNSVNFWLQETHKSYDSDFTVDDLRHPTKSMETYRALQVLCSRFNDCISPMAIPIIKWTVIGATITCSYVLIRSMNHIFMEEFPGILLYPVGSIVCSSGAFGFMSLSARMFDMAGGCIDSWCRTKHKGFRRILMSCPCLKVKVGPFYFITVATTITFFKVVFDFLTDCVIAFP